MTAIAISQFRRRLDEFFEQAEAVAQLWVGIGMNLHQGRFAVGAFDVDARTGAILDQEQRVAAIQARAAELAAALPAYASNPHIAVEYLAPGAVTAQNDWWRGSWWANASLRPGLCRALPDRPIAIMQTRSRRAPSLTRLLARPILAA